jgi:hypothetical protein
MYDFCWPDIERILLENSVNIQYDGDKAIGVISKDEDNDIKFFLSDGIISEISLKNDRVRLKYKVSENEVYLNISYGKRSATVINEIN